MAVNATSGSAMSLSGKFKLAIRFSAQMKSRLEEDGALRWSYAQPALPRDS